MEMKHNAVTGGEWGWIQMFAGAGRDGFKLCRDR